MSRVGKRPIPIPSGVTVTPKDGGVEVKGPKGILFQKSLPKILVTLEEGNVVLRREDEARDTRAAHGLFRTLVDNMVTGVAKGFEKRLEIVGVGYRAEVTGNSLVLALGFSKPVNVPIPKNLTVKTERPTLISIAGADRQAVGAYAASIRALRKPEPYKGKGVKYVDERIRRKVGKSGATAGAK